MHGGGVKFGNAEEGAIGSPPKPSHIRGTCYLSSVLCFGEERNVLLEIICLQEMNQHRPLSGAERPLIMVILSVLSILAYFCFVAALQCCFVA